MSEVEWLPGLHSISPVRFIRRTNADGAEYWSSRDFAQVLGYSDYRNFEQVVKKGKTACFNSGHRIKDHFVDITEMIEIGKRIEETTCDAYPARLRCGHGTH
ncbi:MAG: hypothetical protein JW993_06600 [Sedimentisphaerales bacterium]|nr:hypothetical protein [Sedimentisphaerales bacterium]